jgi:hypothetical protein
METSHSTACSSNQNPFTRGLLLALWLSLFALFFSLRFDASVRTYFQIDDLVVVWLVDDAVNHGNWQPDWDRVGKKAAEETGKDFSAARAASRDLPHDHHYNFSAHILLSAAIIKPLRVFGINASTVALLHHIALVWDTLSLLLLIAAARRLGGQPLAICSAIIYTFFPLAVQGSHYARPDAFLTAMGSALLWLALQKKSFIHWRWLLANGLVLGLAVGGKASQLMLGIFPALASSAVLLDKAQWKPGTLARIAADGIALFALVAAVLWLMFFVGDMTAQDFWLSMRSIQLYYEHPNPPDTLEHYSYGAQLLKTLHYFYATLGWPLVLALFAGAITLARKPDKLPLLLLTVPLVFFLLYFASMQAFFDRSFCSLASGIVLLAAIGITTVVNMVTGNAIRALPARIFAVALITVLACWKPLVIQYHLQTEHLRQYHDPERLAFQQKLRQDWSEKTGVDFWLKNIDTRDLFSQSLPEKPQKNPRIYVAEDMNDWNSRDYLKKLRDNGFVQIAEFEGDFADMPTNSLITVHQAARFVYFVRSDEVPAPKSP